MLPSNRSNKSDANMQVIVKNSEVILNFKLNWSSSYSDIIGFLHFVVCGLMLRLEKAIGGAPHLNWSCRLIQGYNLTEKIKTTARDNFPSRHMSRNWGYSEFLSFVESSISDFSAVEVLSYLHCRCELWKFVQRFALRQWNGIISCLMFYCRNTQAAKVCITSKM